MQLSNIPAKFPVPFASGAGSSYIRTIPTASQITITPGAASLTDGFPPLNFQPLVAGGVPCSGLDMNGILYAITSQLQWLFAGGAVNYDAAFQASIGGYPNGAQVQSTVTPGLVWMSVVDSNLTNPDAAGAGWARVGRLCVTAAMCTAGTLIFYCSPTGNDTTGTGSISNPFQNPAAAFNWAYQHLDFQGLFGFMVYCLAGTFPSQQYFQYMPVGLASWTLTGAPGTTPSTVRFVNSGAVPNSPVCLYFSLGNYCTVSGIYLSATGCVGGTYVAESHCIFASGATVVVSNIILGPCTGMHFVGQLSANIWTGGAPYTVSGAAYWHVTVGSGSIFTNVNSQITLIATAAGQLNFSQGSAVGGWASASEAGLVQHWGSTFQVAPAIGGTATAGYNIGGSSVVAGYKYTCGCFGVISVNGAGQNFLPGTIAGTNGSIMGVSLTTGSGGYGGYYG